MAYRLGVDIGGTFTDLVLFDPETGAVWGWKVPSTPRDPAAAVAAAIRRALARAGAPPQAVRFFGHGTTVATNAVVEGRLPPTGLLTTRGFRDLLEIRRQRRPHLYDLMADPPPPLVPRHLRREVTERLLASGQVHLPLDAAGAGAELDLLARAGVAAVAVCLLHAYVNPAHEQALAALARRRLPGVFVQASHEVAAEFREYERFSTTALSAALGPVVGGYLERMVAGVRELGLPETVYITQGNGGVVSAAEAARWPLGTALSGPAAGAVAGAAVAAARGEQQVITLDMGGTSADICLIQGGRPALAAAADLGGHPARLPVLDVHPVGAGGGSIARVDAGGMLQVGPASAGADPGPACYGRGGTAATVTDACAVLGWLGAELAGGVRLDPAAARAAVAARVGQPLGLAPEAAALGIVRVVAANMAGALRRLCLERGADPRGFLLLAAGGAGPLFAGLLARETGQRRVLVPPLPGMFSAWGLLAADLRRDFSRTRLLPLDPGALPDLEQVAAELAGQAAGWLDREEVAPAQRRLELAADLRYAGQDFELAVTLDGGLPAGGAAGPPLAAAGGLPRFTPAVLERLAAGFARLHRETYGFDRPGHPVEVVTLRVTATGLVPKPGLPAMGRGPTGAAATSGAAPTGGPAAAAGRSGRPPDPVARRPLLLPGTRAPADSPVYRRAALPAGTRLAGPALVEEDSATTLLLPGDQLRVEPGGALLIQVGEGWAW